MKLKMSISSQNIWKHKQGAFIFHFAIAKNKVDIHSSKLASSIASDNILQIYTYKYDPCYNLAAKITVWYICASDCTVKTSTNYTKTKYDIDS